MHKDLETRIEIAKSAERRLKKHITQLENFASAWEDRSALALRKGEEDLAREALAHKLKHLRQREELLAQLSQAELVRSQLEKELKETAKKDSKNIVTRVAEEIKAAQQDLKQAREAENALLASILEEKIEALLDLGRQAWKVAFPDEASSYEKQPWERDSDSFSSSYVDLYSKEIDAELENLKHSLDRLY